MTDHRGRALVAGAGAGGIQAALALARAGYDVILAEASDHTGGIVSRLDVQFPTTACGFCRMLPMADRDRGSQYCLRRGLSHDRIDLRLSAALVSLEGEPGGFTASLEQRPSMVDRDKCMGCGICESVCPVEIPDPFNEGLTVKKAVSRPCPQSFTDAYTIDEKACTYCGACVSACPTDAITLRLSHRAAFRILVVDDESVVRNSMREWLTLEGFGVETADSGQKALEMMAGTAFEVMLTDIKMPGMDGVELLTRAKAQQPGITVIMMTAYAEVDSAVSAMKQGALDYVTKPFDPETVIALVEKIYEKFRGDRAVKESVDTVILAGSTEFSVPDQNIFGYGRIPNVVTALAFERCLSPAGSGRIRDIRRIAWLQCVGSRDRDHGYCSSVCCMISVKQAILASRTIQDLERAAVFYMDLRTPGKDFDVYRSRAETAGVSFIRSRIHSISPEPGPDADRGGGPITLRYISQRGEICEEVFDMVVLAVGQALDPVTRGLIQSLEIETDPWGLVRPEPFAPHETSRPGIFTTGGLAGFKDIETTVTLGAAAAMAAAQAMALAGKPGFRQAETFEAPGSENRHPDRAAPGIHVIVCRCSRYLEGMIDGPAIFRKLAKDPEVAALEEYDDLCVLERWEAVLDRLRSSPANRLVIAGCPECINPAKLAEAAKALQVSLRLVRSVDILGLSGKLYHGTKNRLDPKCRGRLARDVMLAVTRAVSGLKTVHPSPPAPQSYFARADFDRADFARVLIVGGGVAGMTAALAVAGCGYGVDLVEKDAALGGNLSWIKQTIEGSETAPLLRGMVESVSAHGSIRVHLSAGVVASSGPPGQWSTTVEKCPESGPSERIRVDHGVVILATGGREAAPRESGPGIYTQKAFQTGLDAGKIDPRSIFSLVMVQCRNCREKDRNYCSRVCCPRALSQSLRLKAENPQSQIYVLYRDMMTPGGLEAFYTRAREAGVIFIPYEVDRPPRVLTSQGQPCRVACYDPVLGRDLSIEADAVVTAVGVTPVLPPALADMFTAQIDDFGFFKAADSKWRPVDALHPRVLGCGLALKPCDLSLARATALAGAIRAVGILSGQEKGAPAHVRTAYCSLCLTCIDACPFHARTLNPETGTIVVDGQACQGCGICASVCPSKAARVEGRSHYLDVIDRVLAL